MLSRLKYRCPANDLQPGIVVMFPLPPMLVAVERPIAQRGLLSPAREALSMLNLTR
jgi:hypothetical protein